ncbi:putative Conserved oligomeric Golgi complex subunit 7 [Cocos nucifera]|uniref:Putative Conserved oligomeric Golgi complex subunit 7 n=1 Tax=Cocos nucifera TaxID=13894 RepID=A0A8K0N6E8_COCNU|nr:putative Conserved oligomeric Golgi complex subunit 7 [Cocos nucifera]
MLSAASPSPAAMSSASGITPSCSAPSSPLSSSNLRRCMNALPDDYKSLVPKLLVDTMSELGASFISRINLATVDVVPETKTSRKG